MIERQADVDASTERYQQLSAAQHTARVEHKFRLMNDKWEQLHTHLRLYADRSVSARLAISLALRA